MKTQSYSSARFSVSITLLLGLTAFCSALMTQPANAQYLAWPPGDRDEVIVNCAPEKCIAYISWASTGKYDSAANPTEAYFGQPEIQESIEKLKSALLKLAQENTDEQQVYQWLSKNDPGLFLKQPAAFFLSSFDIANKTASGGAVMALGDLEDKTKAMMDVVVKNDSKYGIKTFEVEGTKCYSVKDGDAPEVQMGIINHYLVIAVGDLKLVDVLANMKTPAPDWLTQIDKRIAIERPAFTVFVDIKSAIAIAMEAAEASGGSADDEMKQFLAVDKIYGFTKFESFQYQSGMNPDGFNQVAHLNHSSPNEGVLAAFAAETLKDKDIKSIPEDISFAAAMKLDPSKILAMVRETAKVVEEEGETQYLAFVEDMKNRFDFDFESDLIKALDGTALFYTAPSLTSPKMVAAVKVKDPASFAKFYSALNQQLKKRLAEQGSELVEVQKKDQTYYEVALPNGLTLCYGLVDDAVYLCNTVRGIVSHLRKKDRDSGKLVQTTRFQELMKQGRAEGYQGVIGFSEFDLSILIETGLPMAKLMFQSKMDREIFDFTLDDLPDTAVLVNGLRPSTSVIYRTDTGLAARGLNDLPVSYDITTSGILIGMLLPAVQQVRAASRRVQAMNNLRVQALALLNYESAHGHFPPAYSVDDDGKPLLSWRVHILPFTEENQLYQKFKLDEPWDSEHNVKLAFEMPEFYKHPGLSLVKNKTVFLAPVGKDTILSDGPTKESGAGNTFSDIPDGTSNTQLLIAADEKHAVIWSAPEDLRVDDLKDDQLTDAVTGYLGMMTTALCDGSTHALGGDEVERMDTKQLRGGLNKSDGVSFDLAP